MSVRKHYFTDETTGRTAKLDNMTDVVSTISYEHHEIHGGSTFAAQHATTGGTALTIAFATPAGTKRAHMTWEFSTESKAHLEVLEGGTWTTNTGTVLAPKNQNRGSASTSMLLEDKTDTPNWTAGGVLLDPTADVAGDRTSLIYTFAGKFTGDNAGIRHEHVLKPDETYQFVLTSDDGSKGLQIRLYWYEHTDAS